MTADFLFRRFKNFGTNLFYLKFYTFVLSAAWTLLGGFFFYDNFIEHKKYTFKIAYESARTHLNRDYAFRLWVNSYGGVYIPFSENRNYTQYLPDSIEKTVETTGGKKLTLITPAHAIKEVMDKYSRIYGIKSQMKSLKPLNPENAPDFWESEALKSFEGGVVEKMKVESIGGEKFLRLMRPVYAETGCIKCHISQGYKAGDIVGGLGINVPLKSLLLEEKRQLLNHGVMAFTFWIIGITIFVSGFFTIKRRIKDQERAEINLKRAHEKLDATISALPDLFLEFDKSGKILNYSVPDEKMLYLEPKAFLGKNIESVLPPDAGLKISSSLKKAAKGELVSGIIYSLDMPDKVRWYELSASRIENREDEESSLIGLIRDVTLWIEAENKLKESESKYRTLLENIPYVIWVTDYERRISYVSPNVEKVIGFTATEICNDSRKYWFNRIHPDDKVRLKEDWENLFRYGKGVNTEFRIETSTGKWILVGNRAVNVYMEKDNYYAYGILSDITDQRNMENRFKQSEKLEAIGQLAGGLAHDFNNQLGGIIGFADLIMEQGEGYPNIEQYAGKIINCAQHVANLTGQLLSFARLGNYLLVPVDIHQLIDEVISVLSHTIDKKITIEKTFNAKISSITGDPSQLQNALLNLGLNARDAMADGGKIEFVTDNVILDEDYCSNHEYEVNPGEFLQISVSDSGKGIDNSIRSHIFEPFFTTKDFGEGTGMGLAAVYGTVKSHKGAIYVYSELGKGAVFKLSFPLAKDVETIPPKPHNVEDYIMGQGHIMLIDDEQVIRELGQRILSKLGYDVTVCKSGMEAIGKYEENYREIDLVIIDLVMPEMNGGEVLKRFREINPAVVAIMSSGYSENGYKAAVGSTVAEGFIQKPYRIMEMSDIVSKIMSIKASKKL